MVPRIAAIHPKILGESCVLCYTLHSKECSAPVPCPLGSRRLMRKFIREALLPMCGTIDFSKDLYQGGAAGPLRPDPVPRAGRILTLRRCGGRSAVVHPLPRCACWTGRSSGNTIPAGTGCFGTSGCPTGPGGCDADGLCARGPSDDGESGK